MTLSKLMQPIAIDTNIDAEDKESAIVQMAATVATSISVNPVELTTALIEREHLGSTGIGAGTAIPHCRMDVKALEVGIFLSPQGIHFFSLDNKPTHIFILLIFSTKSPSCTHLATLSRIARLLRQYHLREELMRAETVAEVKQALSFCEASF